jgi:hypothetical protein
MADPVKSDQTSWSADDLNGLADAVIDLQAIGGSRAQPFSLWRDTSSETNAGLVLQLTQIAPAGYKAGAYYYYGTNGKGPNGLAWVSGIDTAEGSGNTDPLRFRSWFLARANADGSVTDFLYAIPDNGNGAAALGIGYVPPRNDFRVSISGQDSDTTQGGLAIRVSTLLTTGIPFGFTDSASAAVALWVDKTFEWNTDGIIQDGFQINASGAANATGDPRSLVLAGTVASGGGKYGFWHSTDGGMILRDLVNGNNIFKVGNNLFEGMATSWGVFSHATTRQTVTGSRGGNAALASLLTALAAYGVVIDSSTA